MLQGLMVVLGIVLVAIVLCVLQRDHGPER